jgi:hypothetical protein
MNAYSVMRECLEKTAVTKQWVLEHLGNAALKGQLEHFADLPATALRAAKVRGRDMRQVERDIRRPARRMEDAASGLRDKLRDAGVYGEMSPESMDALRARARFLTSRAGVHDAGADFLYGVRNAGNRPMLEGAEAAAFSPKAKRQLIEDQLLLSHQENGLGVPDSLASRIGPDAFVRRAKDYEESQTLKKVLAERLAAEQAAATKLQPTASRSPESLARMQQMRAEYEADMELMKQHGSATPFANMPPKSAPPAVAPPPSSVTPSTPPAMESPIPVNIVGPKSAPGNGPPIQPSDETKGVVGNALMQGHRDARATMNGRDMEGPSPSSVQRQLTAAKDEAAALRAEAPPALSSPESSVSSSELRALGFDKHNLNSYGLPAPLPRVPRAVESPGSSPTFLRVHAEGNTTPSGGKTNTLTAEVEPKKVPWGTIGGVGAATLAVPALGIGAYRGVTGHMPWDSQQQRTG